MGSDTIAAPGSLEATAGLLPVERALIGALLTAPADGIPPLLPDEFTLDRHRLIWGAILAVSARGDRPDLVMVRQELAATGYLESAGGPATLALCIEEGCLALQVKGYARLIREGARTRALAALGRELSSQGFPEEEIQRRLRELPGPMTVPMWDPAEPWRRIVKSWGEERILTGLTPLDEKGSSLTPGELVVVGGRTSHGKTAFLVDLSLRMAQAGISVDFLTLEVTPAALLRRQVSNLTGIPSRTVKDGTLDPGEFERCEEAVRTIQGLPLTVTGLDELKSLDEERIVARVAVSNARVMVLDHLQKITTRDENRAYGLERVMSALHAIALRDQRVLLIAAQLNREAEGRRGAPRLSDLRDCGAIEILSQQVWLLYWGWRHRPDQRMADFEVILAKNADGPVGKVALSFEAATGRFGAPAEQDP